MNGGLTYKDIETLKRKAKALDEIREWLHGRIDSERLLVVEALVERAYREEQELS